MNNIKEITKKDRKEYMNLIRSIENYDELKELIYKEFHWKRPKTREIVKFEKNTFTSFLRKRFWKSFKEFFDEIFWTYQDIIKRNCEIKLKELCNTYEDYLKAWWINNKEIQNLVQAYAIQMRKENTWKTLVEVVYWLPTKDKTKKKIEEYKNLKTKEEKIEFIKRENKKYENQWLSWFHEWFFHTIKIFSKDKKEYIEEVKEIETLFREIYKRKQRIIPSVEEINKLKWMNENELIDFLKKELNWKPFTNNKKLYVLKSYDKDFINYLMRLYKEKIKPNKFPVKKK